MKAGLLTIIVCLVFGTVGAQQAGQAPFFTDITDTAGINHQFRVYEGMFGGGICVFDLNQDGFDDLYITGGMNSDQLYLNKGDGTFANVFEGSGLEITRAYVTQGVAGADVNRDGWVDLFVTTITEKDSANIIPRAPNLLFLNQGDGTFRDVTEAWGLLPLNSFSTGASFGDFNADGWPDLYVGNYFLEYQGDLTYISDATIAGAHQTAKGYLLENQQGKGFKDVYADYGLKHRGFGFGAVFTDYDNDGDQDLLVNHDFGYKAIPSFLLRNESPWRRFKDVSKSSQMDLKINAMAAAVGDYNEDGLLDYFVTNIRFNRLMTGQGRGKPFVDRLDSVGMRYFAISWGANFADFDQDGDLDLFVANGDLNPYCTAMADFFFVNEGGKFTEQARAAGLNDYGIGRGSVVFDIENDGDLDLLVVNQKPVQEQGYPVPSTTRLYRNDMAQGHWLKVALRGIQAESHGLGSRVTIVAGGRRMIREIDGGCSSHLSQNATIAHVGLGSVTVVDSVIVTWTGGNRQILTQVPADQLLMITEEPGGWSGWGWVVGAGVLLVLGAAGWVWFRRYSRT
ncbi:MAG: CRTAC1 family protein [Bacteroidia bacterium]|nr:CRTAC1 family protein [Bacteroidia bacterium]